VSWQNPAKKARRQPVFQKFIARQLAQPSGLVGRRFTARWLNKANARMNRLTLEQLAPVPADRILEVGFGGGDLLERILSVGPTAFVAGIDLSADMVRLAGERLQRYLSNRQLEVRCGNIESIPYGAGEFTKLCSVNTIYFWRDPSVALAECRRVLRPGGQILLCFNSRQDLEKWPIHKHGFRLYEIAEVEDLLRVAGFSSIAVASAHDVDQGLFYCVKGVA
jgi:SAM-dependent methyltransferase